MVEFSVLAEFSAFSFTFSEGSTPTNTSMRGPKHVFYEYPCSVQSAWLKSFEAFNETPPTAVHKVWHQPSTAPSHVPHYCPINAWQA